MSWKPEVLIDEHDGRGPTWVGNALRFATKDEAEANVAYLKACWLLVIDTRVVETDDPANYAWNEPLGLVRLKPIDIGVRNV